MSALCGRDLGFATSAVLVQRDVAHRIANLRPFGARLRQQRRVNRLTCPVGCNEALQSVDAAIQEQRDFIEEHADAPSHGRI